jgi:hypothetical protein
MEDLTKWMNDSNGIELKYSPDDFYVPIQINTKTSASQIWVMYPLVGSEKCCLKASGEKYYYSKNGVITECEDSSILNALPLNAIYMDTGNTKRLVVYNRLLDLLENEP